MKRTELTRRTPLRRTGMSPRRTPLKRGYSRLGLRKPRPGGERAKLIVEARSKLRCEACVEPHWGTEWHHRVRRSQGGLWSASNGLWLCRRVHEWITHHPVSARVKGWGLWRHEVPADEPVLYRGMWALLGDDGSVTSTREVA